MHKKDMKTDHFSSLTFHYW